MKALKLNFRPHLRFFMNASRIGVALLFCTHAFADGVPEAARTPVEKLCPVPGFFQENVLGTFTIYTCHLISNRTCLYLPGPCPETGGGGGTGQSVPAPPGLNIPEGQKFIGRYNQEGEFVVTLVDDYTIGNKRNEDGTYSITVTFSNK